MKSLLLLAVLMTAQSLAAPLIRQQWALATVDVSVEDSTVSGSSGTDPVEHFVTVTLSTTNFRYLGLGFDLVLLMDDGSVVHFYRKNVTVPETRGEQIAVTQSTGIRSPASIIRFYVYPVISDYATLLVGN